MTIRSILRRIGFAAALVVAGNLALAAPLSFSTGVGFLAGPRLIDGTDLNKIVTAVNVLITQAAGTVAGIYTGTFNGILGGTTPAAATVTALTASGHIATGATPPVLTSCGTTPAIVGSDTAGEVTMGTGSPTGCVITFASAYTSAPFCQVVWQTNIASMQYTTAPTAITLVQTGTSSNKANYQCIARSGG